MRRNKKTFISSKYWYMLVGGTITAVLFSLLYMTDMLIAGIHGQDIDRLHSSNITLGTIADDRKGRRGGNGSLRSSLFPPVRSLKNRYTYLQKHSWLLPVAWTQRAGSYLLHKNSEQPISHPSESIRIGKERVALLREYGIIGKDES